MEQQEIEKIMKSSAQEAIDMAKNELKLELDGTFSSLAVVDNIIAQYALGHQREKLSDEHVFTICNLFGGYLGEVFIEHVGGQWIYDNSVEDEPFVAVAFNDKSFAFPGVCYQKLVNDNAVSVQRYYELAQEGVTQ